jgi:hypothetical protein
MREGEGGILAGRGHAEGSGQRSVQSLHEGLPFSFRNNALLLVVRFIQSIRSIFDKCPLVPARLIVSSVAAAVILAAIVDALPFIRTSADGRVAVAAGTSHGHFAYGKAGIETGRAILMKGSQGAAAAAAEGCGTRAEKKWEARGTFWGRLQGGFGTDFSSSTRGVVPLSPVTGNESSDRLTQPESA